MTMLVEDPYIEADIISERARIGADHHDEVWEGVYFVSPGPNSQHQRLVAFLTGLFMDVADRDGIGSAYPGLNVTDREEDWTTNFRIPDVFVILNDSKAKVLEDFCLGGPDFVVEILSPKDRAREKFDFYAGIGVREILLIDRKPWALELYRLDSGAMTLVGKTVVGSEAGLASEVLPLTFSLANGEDRPAIVAVHSDGQRRWTL